MPRKYYLYIFLSLLFVAYVVVEKYKPKPFDWSPTFLTADTNPYGCYVINERVDDLFTQGFESSFLTLYERKEADENALILTEGFYPTETELEVLMTNAAKGMHFLIAASSFSPLLLDTLGLGMDSRYGLPLILDADSVEIVLPDQSSYYSRSLFSSFLELDDSSQWQVQLRDWEDHPVLVSRQVGQGMIHLSTTPLLFTNFGILQDPSFAEVALTLLPDAPLHYYLYYHLGKIEVKSPLRYVLSEEALTWALYILLATLALLMIINSQRRQRVIPIITPPVNGTLLFIRTMAALSLKKRNHGAIALKLSEHFLDRLTKRYYKQPAFSEAYYHFLSDKAGVSVKEVSTLFHRIEALRSGASMDSKELQSYYQALQRIK